MNNFGVGSADGFENSPVTLSVTKGLIVGVGGFRRPVLKFLALRFFALLGMTFTKPPFTQGSLYFGNLKT